MESAAASLSKECCSTLNLISHDMAVINGLLGGINLMVIPLVSLWTLRLRVVKDEMLFCLLIRQKNGPVGVKIRFRWWLEQQQH